MPIGVQYEFTPPDHHWHRCLCGMTFSHHRLLIAKGCSAAAHKCPLCEMHVNERLEFGTGTDEPEIDVLEWYG